MAKYSQIITTTLILSLLIISGCYDTNPKKQKSVSKGVLDISQWDFTKNPEVEINGDWEFYYGRLLTPKDFSKGITPSEYIRVPSAWNRETQHPDTGYATYRVNIITGEYNLPLVIENKRIFSSYKVWANNNLICQVGKVAKTKNDYIPDLKMGFIGPIFAPANDTLQIVIQVANFDDYKPGILSSISLGNNRFILKEKISSSILFFGISAIIFIMAIYHLILFFYHKKETSVLVFSLLSFTLLAFGLVTNDTFVKNIISPNFHIITRITHFSISVYPALITLFFYLQFKNEVSKKFLYATLIFSSLLLLFSLFFDIYLVRKYISVKVAYTLIVSTYFLIYALPKSIIKKNRGSVWAFIGMFFLFVSIINDILFAVNIVKTGFFSQYGFALYVVFQSFNIAEKFSYTFKYNAELNIDLDFQKNNLEEIVKKRTSEIENKNLQILQRNEELNLQKENLQFAYDQINTHKKEIELQHEQIKSSIRYARTIQNAILPGIADISEYIDYFIFSKPKDIISGDFYWFSKIKKIPQEIDADTVHFVVVADCTGHGIPGALMSIIGNRLLNEIVNEKNIYDPAEALTQLDLGIKKILQQEVSDNQDGMDIAFCRIEKKNNEIKRIVFSGAKSPLYHIDNKTKKLFKIKGSPKSVGGITDIDFEFDFYFTNIEIIPTKGDLIYLATDGYADQNNKDRQRFGSVRFMKLLKIISSRPLDKQKEKLEYELDDHRDGEELRDDITVLGMLV